MGWLSDPSVADAVHELDHRGAVEYVELAASDATRRRLRAVTDRGTELAIALDRRELLGDGAVLLLTEARAVVVRLTARKWLRVRPRDIRSALALGHRAGHLHWTVVVEPDSLAVAVEGRVEDYLDRLRDLDGLDIRSGDASPVVPGSG